MKRKMNVLFGYSCTPAWGLNGVDPGGFSIELDTNGLIRYKKYIFDCIEKEEKTAQLSSTTIQKINAILENNSAIIKSLNKYLDNGSSDGTCNQFNFMGKVITGYNVSFSDEESLLKRNPWYYKTYIKNVRQENVVIHIFNSIANELQDELKAKGIELNLFVCENPDVD